MMSLGCPLMLILMFTFIHFRREVWTDDVEDLPSSAPGD